MNLPSQPKSLATIMAKKPNFLRELKEARQRADALRARLPPSIEVAALGVRSKAPFQLLAVREALIWRTEELARNACDAIERQDFAAAGLLTRAVAESTAMIWHLLHILETRSGRTPAELNTELMRALSGSRIWENQPQAINILTCVDRVNKTIPGFRQSYDSLSEYAHPNWIGVVGLFSEFDRNKLTTHFGRGFNAEIASGQLFNALNGSLMAFEYGYNKIEEKMPAFLSELEKIWPDENARAKR